MSNLKPVDSAAVDQRRKHSESVSKRVSDGTHTQNHVQVTANPLNKEVIHGQRTGIHL